MKNPLERMISTGCVDKYLSTISRLKHCWIIRCIFTILKPSVWSNIILCSVRIISINTYVGIKCCVNDQFTNVTDKEVRRNVDLENQIKLMIRLIRRAPAFDKSHTVYRFIVDDSFLSHLKVGDTYQDVSFMSTTRNPFYYAKNYTFGYILMKLKLPADLKGVGLCIESYSNFPEEEEIVLPPTSKLRLDKITNQIEETDQQHLLNRLVKKKYEFTWLDNSYIRTVRDRVKHTGITNSGST